MPEQSHWWVGIITPHARMRYLERISSPNTYSHLNSCERSKKEPCEECTTLLFQVKRVVEASKKYMDVEIRKKIGKAFAEDCHVKNPSFLEIVRRFFPEERHHQFLRDGRAVFVIVNPDDEPSPVLVTVMSVDMLDGMVIQNAPKDEIIAYFDRWKREDRLRAERRVIKKL